MVGVGVVVGVAVEVATTVGAQVAVKVGVAVSVVIDIGAHMAMPAATAGGVPVPVNVGGSALPIWPTNPAFWALARGRAVRMRRVVSARAAIVEGELMNLWFIARFLGWRRVQGCLSSVSC